jgi:small subunit ribosomal protein S6
MKHQYETIIIVRPDITEDKEREVIRRYIKFFEAHDAKIINSESWGRKKLAYPVQEFKEGYYHDFTFICEQSVIDELVETYKTDDNIIKNCVVQMNDKDPETIDPDASAAISERASSTSSPIVQPEVDALDVLLGFDHYAK